MALDEEAEKIQHARDLIRERRQLDERRAAAEDFLMSRGKYRDAIVTISYERLMASGCRVSREFLDDIFGAGYSLGCYESW